MNRKLTYIIICLLVLACKSKTDKSEDIKRTDSLKTDIVNEKVKKYILVNTKDYLIFGNKLAKIKIIKEKDIDKFPSFEILNSYGEDIIIGENIEWDSVEIFRKYNPKTRFQDFKVDVYQGKLADPDFSTDPEAKMFKTRIKTGCEKGVNFAGHYTLVTWGCGSPCQSGVVIDRKTGKIFSGYGTAFGSSFRKDSKMIIMNFYAIDTITNLIKVCPYCVVNHEIWTGIEFNKIE